MRVLLSLVVLLGLAGLLGADDAEAKKALAPFQGKWRFVKVDEPGRGGPSKEQLEQMSVHVEGDQMAFFRGDQKLSSLTLKLTGNKNEIDLSEVRRAGGPDDKSETRAFPGIYKLEGEQWTICMCRGRGDKPAVRPEKYEVLKQDDKEQAVIVLERVK